MILFQVILFNANIVRFTCFVSLIEPENVKETLVDEFWVKAIEEDFKQFERNDVQILELI